MVSLILGVLHLEGTLVCCPEKYCLCLSYTRLCLRACSRHSLHAVGSHPACLSFLLLQTDGFSASISPLIIFFECNDRLPWKPFPPSTPHRSTASATVYFSCWSLPSQQQRFFLLFFLPGFFSARVSISQNRYKEQSFISKNPFSKLRNVGFNNIIKNFRHFSPKF
jgi:hypothetical protein